MSSTGQPRALARCRLASGERVLIAQRINGRVAVSDVPAGGEGHVFLVERDVESDAGLHGLLAACVADSLRRGEPAVLFPIALRSAARL